MKQLIFISAVAMATSLFTVVVYEYFDREESKTVGYEDTTSQNGSYSKLTNFHVNQSPFNRPMRSFEHLGGENMDFVDAAAFATPCVVYINGKTQSTSRYDIFFGGGAGLSSGSGVIVSADGYILTNNHVVDNAIDLKVTLNDKREYPVKVVGRDISTDLALLKISDNDLAGKSLPYLEFADSDALQVGEWVLAVGNPFNLTSTVTAGIVSAKGRNIDILAGESSIESFIQTDAAVNPGNSGGALVTTKGKLVGINTAIITKSGRYEGYSFAIPANLASKVMYDLKEYGEVQRGFLGVRIQDISAEIFKDMKLSSYEGVYLEKVNANGAADEAGLKDGDIILAVNGQRTKNSSHLQEQIAKMRPGDKAILDYQREGKTAKTTILLRNKRNAVTLDEPRKDRASFSKITVEDLEKKLGGSFRDLSTEEKRRLKKFGVLVIGIRTNSVLEKANMEKNFIITDVNDQPVRSVEELLQIVRESGGSISLNGFYEEYIDQGDFSYVFEI